MSRPAAATAVLFALLLQAGGALTARAQEPAEAGSPPAPQGSSAVPAAGEAGTEPAPEMQSPSAQNTAAPAEAAVAPEQSAPGPPAAPPVHGELPPVVVEQKARPKQQSTARRSSPQRPAAAVREAASPKVQSGPPASAPPADTGAATSSVAPSDAQELQSKPGLSPLTAVTVGEREAASKAAATSDAAALLANVPGVSLYQGGGVSSLPAIDGLADDRVRVLVNNAPVTSACANHMNPPLSYVDPSQVKRIDVAGGLSPVSYGGDSLGGTILVETKPPEFANSGEGTVSNGQITASWRSNGRGISTSASASAATTGAGVSYTGAWTRAESHEDGDGATVGSTEYEATNHSLSLALKGDATLAVLEGGMQNIPYQGFVNQPMDMELNHGWHLSGRIERDFDWGRLAFDASYQETRHKMNFLREKQDTFEAAGWGANWVMPMNTFGTDAAVTLKADIKANDADTLRIGAEAHHQTLEDWWPPVCSTPYCGMGPETFLNINDGRRTRLGNFLEWEHAWDEAWTTIAGVRGDFVSMTAGDVAPYETIEGDIDTAAAERFNARDHARDNYNFDTTLLARYEPRSMLSFEGGYARKTRSPNLYELYAWGESPMTSQMVTWFGDSNGYVGNLDLAPEVAHRLSFTLGLHDETHSLFDLRLTPYVTYVDDFINAEKIAPDGWVNGFNQLRFVNHDARLYGLDVSARALAADWGEGGKIYLSAIGGVVRGEDRVTGEPLYHMMPWNGRIVLEHRLGGWTTIAELVAVASKTFVDEARLEPETPDYAIFNLKTSYTSDDIRLDVGVDNVFDTLYFAPLGGTNYTDYLFPGHPVAGMGRSLYTGLTVKF